MERKNFNECVKNAKSEVKNAVYSPFYVTNELNKMANGTISRTYGLDMANVRAMAKLSRAYFGGRYAFSVDMLQKDYKGRFCVLRTYDADKHGALMADETTNADGTARVYTLADGREVIDGRIMHPIKCTFVAMFAAYCAAIKAANTDAENIKKAAEKAKKAAAKERANFDKMRAACVNVFGPQFVANMTADEIREKYAIIKAA